MELKPCPKCGREVSDLAYSCPGCGNLLTPIPSDSPADPPTDVQAIEATGKTWKIVQGLGVLVIVLGMLTCTGSANGGDGSLMVAGGWLTFVGFVLLVVGRVGAWWHHG